MQTHRLFEDLQYKEGDIGHAQALHADHTGRALRWTIKPGQAVRPHDAPSTPVYLIVLRGNGLFAGGDGIEQAVGPMTLLVFAPGETHSIRAEDEELVFLTVLHEAPHASHGH